MQGAERGVIPFPDRVSRPADFSAFFAQEHAKVFKALYFVTGNLLMLPSSMQDAFLKLWERWDTIDRIDDPTAYLFRVALNGSRMRARSARRAAKNASDTDPGVRGSTRSTSAKTCTACCSNWPRGSALPRAARLYGYGSEEAARIMHIRPSTVRALATQGRAVLRATGGPHA